MDLIAIILVGIGGIIGAICRYMIAYWVSKKNQSAFPYGTFIVNILGCFFMGFFSQIFLPNSYERFLVCGGFIGAFTTFSTFIFEIDELQSKKQKILNGIYIVLSIILGLLAIIFGEEIASMMIN